MNLSYISKANKRDKMNIERFSELHGIGRGRTFFFTLTFRDNVVDKKEASAMWNNLLVQLKRFFITFRYVSVAERQVRGAWHFHVLCHCPLLPSLIKFKDFVRGFVLRSSKSYGFIHAKWTCGRDFKGISNYLSKYLTKENREPGIRYVGYSNNWVRACRLPFSWVGGKSAEWRKNCSLLYSVLGVDFKDFYTHASYDDLMTAVRTLSIDFIRDWFKCHSDLSCYHRLICKIDGVIAAPVFKYTPVYFHCRVVSATEQIISYDYRKDA